MESEANAYGLNPNKFFLFVHSREPEEIARFVKDFNAATVFIDRPQEEAEYSNHADEKVENYEYDFIISNDGSLSQLQTNAKLFLSQIKDERGNNIIDVYFNSMNKYCTLIGAQNVINGLSVIFQKYLAEIINM